MNKTANHFLPLDGLRGIAILAVILSHSYNLEGAGTLERVLTSFAKSGWVGVTLFFVLSGFLITGILLDSRSEPGWYRNFLARRTLRIFPLYFGFLAAYWFLLPRWSLAAEDLRVPTGRAAFCYWLYLANMQETIAGMALSSFPALEHLWSLAVEEQVYFVWPLIVGLSRWRALPRLFIALILLSLSWKVGVTILRQPVTLRYMWTPACLDAFAAGGLVAWASRDDEWSRRLSRISRGGALGVGLLLLGLAIGQGFHFNFWLNPVPMLTVGTTGAALFFALLIGVCLTSKDESWLNRALSVSWLRWCGRYSYAAYVFHMVLVELLLAAVPGWVDTSDHQGRTGILGALGFTATIYVLSFGTAWASWNLWERYFIALKRFFPSSSRVVRPVGE